MLKAVSIRGSFAGICPHEASGKHCHLAAQPCKGQNLVALPRGRGVAIANSIEMICDECLISIILNPFDAFALFWNSMGTDDTIALRCSLNDWHQPVQSGTVDKSMISPNMSASTASTPVKSHTPILSYIPDLETTCFHGCFKAELCQARLESQTRAPGQDMKKSQAEYLTT